MAEFTTIEFVLFILIGLSLAEFAIQIVISELSHWIKGAMLLRQPYNKKLDAFCNPILWRKLFNKAWFIASPIIFLTRIHRFISELLSCPWCIGFWLMLSANLFYFKMDLITALLLAPICLVWVTILDKLHS